MTNNYKFSAILPIYKGVNFHTFKKPFESIINQTLKPNELLVIFDGPVKSNIRELIKEYQGKYNFIKIINFPSNRGLGYVLNRAVKLCKNKYIARCDADDISKKNRFKKQIEFLIKYPKVDVLGTNIIELFDNKFYSKKKMPYNHDDIIKKINFRNPINHSSIIFKKKKLVQSGNYKEMFYFEDYYMWFRMIKKGCYFKNMSDYLVYMNVDENFYSRRTGLKYFKYYFVFLKRLYKEKNINILIFFLCLLVRSPIIFINKNLIKYIYLRILRNN